MNHDELAARLAKLERENLDCQRTLDRFRRATWCGVALVALSLFAGGVLQDEPRTGVFEKLVIQDTEGRNRMILGFDKFHKNADETIPGLFVLDADGQRRVMLGGDKTAAGLWLAEEGRTRLSLTTTPHKFAGMGIFSEPGSPDRGQIGLYYSEKGHPLLTFNDRNGLTRIGMGLFELSKPALSLNDGAGKAFFSQTEP